MGTVRRVIPAIASTEEQARGSQCQLPMCSRLAGPGGLDGTTCTFWDSRHPIDAEGWSVLMRDNFKVMLGKCRNERPAGELGDHPYFVYWNVDGLEQFYRELAA